MTRNKMEVLPPDSIDQARRIYLALFDDEPSENVLNRYAGALKTYNPALSIEDSMVLNRIFEKKLDLEAVEYIWRLKRRKNPLSQRVQTISFLAEIENRNLNKYVNLSDSRIEVLFRMSLSVARTGYLYIKGSYLVWRHSLV